MRQLGVLDYAEAWQLQRDLADARLAGGPDTLLLLEHPSVYTAGKRTESHERPVDGVAVVDVDRGGKITWHGPGQLVGYPVIALGEPLDVVKYVRRLEEALIEVCAGLSLDAGQVDGRSGVWLPATGTTPARKVAAIGIRVARGVTLHGFALNCGAWTEKDAKTGELKDGNYVKAAERMYEAARRLNTDFKLMMSPDGATQFLPDMVRRFYKHPNQFRWNGKAVISGWAGTLRWGEPVRTVRGEGYEFLFVPNTHLVPKYSMAYSHEAADWQLTGHDPLDGYFLFAIDGTVNDLLRDNAVIRRAAYHHGKIFMAGVAPAYNSPNLRDFRGFRGYDTMWQGIVRDRPEWVEIVTWNDYTEDSQLMPWRWQQDWEKQVVSRDESFLDATGYYARWFKSCRQPAIAQDKVYYTYRNRSQ